MTLRLSAPSALLLGALALGVCGAVGPLGAQQSAPAAPAAPAASATGRRELTTADLLAWKSIRGGVLSNDGRWFAYLLAPNEGDATVIVRPTARGGTEMRFPVGEAPSGGGAAVRPGAGDPPVVISGDSKWAAFLEYPTRRDARRLRRQQWPAIDKVALVNLATGAKREFDRTRRFAFSGEKPGWIALQTYPAGTTAGAPTAAGPMPGGPGAAPATGRVESSDLLLYDLASGETINVGNVGEFAFDESGRYLAYTIEARGRVGNGVQLRSMASDVVRALDNADALYRGLAWADSGLALAVLRGTVDTTARDTLYSVVTFTGFAGDRPTKRVLDPAAHGDFPAGMKVVADRAPRFSADFGAVFFGIREARKALPRTPATLATAAPEEDRAGRPSVIQAGAPGAGGTLNQPRVDPDDENPSLVLWHWKDPRLQSQQLVQEQMDRRFSYLAEYRFADARVLRLADDSVRSVTPLPRERFALGTDTRAYEQHASYSGRLFRDVYTIDLVTGVRRLVMKKSPSGISIPSPDGGRVLTWGEDGHWWVLDLATGARRNITKDVPTSFVDTEDDHNDLFPPAIDPQFAGLGWSKDGSAVLLSDHWDVWKVPVNGGAAVNLTGDGRKTRVRYRRRYQFDPKEKGIDLARPLYFATYGEWTKREGLARVEPGRAGATALVAADAALDVRKARDADVFVYTKQTVTDYPNFWVASPGGSSAGALRAGFASSYRITDADPQQKEIAWSSGARLVDYVSDKGDTLQAALLLPANYEPGKRYPTVVYFYEKMSQMLHHYWVPNATQALNPGVYTSRGYAVLMPDITYKVNDPGMSAVWCMVPAVQAAIATGIVDSAHVGIHGHSWGGYQTAFLVTQTNIFRAAIAGAPLTDLVSMYSSIYWNSGGTNQAIFESSQGRFKGNFIENYDAYIRNSPAFHADKVQTPLMILHNDKDGAVDFNQGITFFNTLRQLGKDVMLLEYVGENHGLARPVNQRDYAIRMREFFDAHLRGMPEPDWMRHGVPRLEMDEHLRARRDAATPKSDLVP